jgi:Cys-tRNA(Pro) deacylase
MAKNKLPSTNALRMLRAANVSFDVHRYPYTEGGGTAHSAQSLGVPEHAVVKTLLMETDAKAPLIILMHGDMQVSTKALARHLGVKSVQPCTPKNAQKHSGYLVGGTSPFGTRKPLQVYVEHTVLELPLIYINGGQRGLLVSLAPGVLTTLLHAQPVTAGRPG